MRKRGLGWAELGLSPRHWKRGTVYALGAVGIVLTAVAIGALLPLTRPFFLADRYATISGALIASMIVIPLQTVIPPKSSRSAAYSTARSIGSGRPWALRRGLADVRTLAYRVLVRPHLRQQGTVQHRRRRPAGAPGRHSAGRGCHRRRGRRVHLAAPPKRGLLAPIALHWSLNGAGALAAAVVWHTALR